MTPEEIKQLEDLLSKLRNLTMDHETETIQYSFRVVNLLISKIKQS